MDDYRKRIENIELRNQRVELDKAWEVSWTRRIAIVVLTYLIVAMYLLAIGDQSPLINALVPAIGFLLSSLAINGLRQIWQVRIKARK